MSNQKKLERMQKRQQQQQQPQQSTAGGDGGEADFSEGHYGSYGVIRSSERPDRQLISVHDLNAALDGQTVWLRGRLHTSRAKGKQCFFVLRQFTHTVQCLAYVQPELISRQMVKYIAGISLESIVDVQGVVQVAPRPVESCTQQSVELNVRQLFVVSSADPRLPLQIEDASRPEPKEGTAEPEGLLIKVNQDTRLGNHLHVLFIHKS